MLRVAWTNYKDGMFCNMKAFDFIDNLKNLTPCITWLFFGGGGVGIDNNIRLISSAVFHRAPP